MVPARLKITFPPDTEAEVLNAVIESGFVGMGVAYRGVEDRVVFLHKFKWSFDLIRAQLDEMKEDKEGFAWEIVI